jgi:ABC-type uncharacterized transport system permease subunit
MFAVCYLAALAIHGVRLHSGGKKLYRTSRWLVIGAFVLHTVFLAVRTREAIAVHGAPLSNWHHWCVVAAWIAAAAYLTLTFSHPQEWQELLVLPSVVGLLALALAFPADGQFGTDKAVRIWGMLHGIFLLLGTVTVALGFSAGTMYLIQANRLKRKLPPIQGYRLPSLEALGRINERLFLWSTFLLSTGLLAGWLLNLVQHRQEDDSLPWTDPTVFTSAVLFGWLVLATCFSWIYKPVRVGRKVAYLTVASFVLMALTLSIVLFGPSAHANSAEATNAIVQTLQAGAAEAQR